MKIKKHHSLHVFNSCPEKNIFTFQWFYRSRCYKYRLTYCHIENPFFIWEDITCYKIPSAITQLPAVVLIGRKILICILICIYVFSHTTNTHVATIRSFFGISLFRYNYSYQEQHILLNFRTTPFDVFGFARPCFTVCRGWYAIVLKIRKINYDALIHLTHYLSFDSMVW